MRKIDTIVLHCSATTPGMDVPIETIRLWHKNKGWRDVGYHYYIRKDGTVEIGRPIDEPGAHVRGHNANTIGVCYEGGLDENRSPSDTMTDAQFHTVCDLVQSLAQVLPGITKFCGHRDFPKVAKACPCFDVSTKFFTIKMICGLN